MPRRTSLPGADLLFGSPPETRSAAKEAPPEAVAPDPAPQPAIPTPAEPPIQPVEAAKRSVSKKSSGPRPRHDEKVTFYCTDSDLTRLEAARLDLRANYRLPSDRGRIVRAAIAEILDDFDARGAESLLVKRLSSE